MGLKKFEEFVSEMNQETQTTQTTETQETNEDKNTETNQETSINEKLEQEINEALGSATGLVAIDLDIKPIQIFELSEYEESNGWTDLTDDVEASIYVMPDDTVEIRSIEVKPYCIFAKFPQLTGEEVRKEQLHRHNWVLRNVDND